MSPTPPPATLCELFQRTAAERGDAPALMMAGHPGYSWSEYAAAVRALAPGFAGLGVRPGQPVALLSGPRPEFHVVDTALMHTGAVPFSLQEGDTLEHLVTNLRTAGVQVLVTERRLLPLARDVAAAYPLEVLVSVDGGVDGGADPAELTLADVAAVASPDTDVEALWRAVGPEDVATLIFTSGTTGVPKAVQLSHRAIAVSEQSTHELAPFGEGGDVLSYLPMSHIAERFMSHYASIVFGVTVHSVPDPDRLYDEIRAVRPTRFFGVPRVYEKLLDRARALGSTDPEVVRAGLGLDRAEYLGVATAPSAYAMLEALAGLGLPVSDIWGMSEAIMCTLNPPDAIRLGTVGRFLARVEGTIAPDGEVLVRGPNEFSGYLGDPVRTAELRDADGWIHTGDVGSIDDGYLTIRGRKKELLITATGRNLAPGAIEGAIKSASPLIDHVVAIAEGRRHVTALIALDAAELAAFVGADAGDDTFADWVTRPEVVLAVADAVEKGNTTLSRPETVRAFRVVPLPWVPGGDELTATSKLRRDVIARTYATQIEELYR